jgi:hypothetical protein
LSRGKEKARAVACLINQKQLGLLYRIALDSDSQDEIAGPINEAGLPPGRVAAHIGLKFGIGPCWLCPSASGASTKPEDSGIISVTIDAPWSSWIALPLRHASSNYCFNCYFVTINRAALGTFDAQPEHEFTTETRVTQPAKTPLFADAIWGVASPLESDWPATDLYNGANAAKGGSMSLMNIPRHAAGLDPCRATGRPSRHCPARSTSSSLMAMPRP